MRVQHSEPVPNFLKIFVVDGKASEKSAAKKAAAIKMLERLTNDCLQKKMLSQITPFTDFE